MRDATQHRFVPDEAKERLVNAPGFDRDEWPDMADPTFGNTVCDYYGTPTYR